MTRIAKLDGNAAKSRPTSRKGRAERALRHAADLAPIVAELRAAGTSLNGIARALNDRGVPTATGKGKWTAVQTRRVVARLESMTRRDPTAKARLASLKARSAHADAKAADLIQTIKELRAAGVTTLRAIAAELNRRGISTPEGKAQWQAGQVHRLLARLK